MFSGVSGAREIGGSMFAAALGAAVALAVKVAVALALATVRSRFGVVMSEDVVP
jgi:hypothetical protein